MTGKEKKRGRGERFFNTFFLFFIFLFFQKFNRNHQTFDHLPTCICINRFQSFYCKFFIFFLFSPPPPPFCSSLNSPSHLTLLTLLSLRIYKDTQRTEPCSRAKTAFFQTPKITQRVKWKNENWLQVGKVDETAIEKRRGERSVRHISYISKLCVIQVSPQTVSHIFDPLYWKHWEWFHWLFTPITLCSYIPNIYLIYFLECFCIFMFSKKWVEKYYCGSKCI